MNELENLVTFVRVADAGGFTAAARSLGVGQPTVSRRISELEAELGVALVQRTTRQLSITEAGLRFLERAREVVDAVERARDAARFSGPLRGELRITAPVSFTHVWLGPRLGQFMRQHTMLDVYLDVADRHIDLVAERMDVAVRMGGPDDANLAGRRLRSGERWFVASPTWLEAHGRPASFSELAHHTGLIFAAAGTHPDGWTLEGVSVTPQRVIVASSGLTLAQFVKDGLGVALLPDWLVEQDLATGALVRLLAEQQSPRLDLWVVWPVHRYQRAATRAFIEWMTFQLTDPQPHSLASCPP